MLEARATLQSGNALLIPREIAEACEMQPAQRFIMLVDERRPGEIVLRCVREGMMDLVGAELREAILVKLCSVAEDLRALGIAHLAVFGSVARGDAEMNSDVDILVELNRDAHVGLFAFAGMQQTLSALLGRKVDLVSRGSLRLDRHANILQEAVEAF